MGVIWTQLLTGTNQTKRGLNHIAVQLAAAGIIIFGAAATLYAGAGNEQGQNQPPAGQTSRFRVETELIVSAGYRRDDLDWNIAGDAGGNNPNVLSELTWDDVASYQVKFQGSLAIPNMIALRGVADYGWIFSGENRDSDYAGNNRTYEFSRSNNSSDDGNLWDASLAVGYPFRTDRTVIATFTPLVGYSYHEQNLTMTDGYQTIPPTGSFAGLDSSYETEWQGPWIGIDVHLRAGKTGDFAERFQAYFSYEYHWAEYHAEADWNLRDNFQHPKSFEHDADGSGWIIRTGFNFSLQRHIALNFNLDYQNWSAEDGTDKVFFADGTTAKTRLNEVNWTTFAAGLGLAMQF
jgi:hypothetical protein